MDQQSLCARPEYFVTAGPAVALRAFQHLVTAGSRSRFALGPNTWSGQGPEQLLRSVLSPGLVRTPQQHIARVIIRSSDSEAALALARAFGSSPGPAVALRATRTLTKARIPQRLALVPSTFISGQRFSHDVSVIVRFLS